MNHDIRSFNHARIKIVRWLSAVRSSLLNVRYQNSGVISGAFTNLESCAMIDCSSFVTNKTAEELLFDLEFPF